MSAVSHRFDRVTMSDATRDLLIAFAAADLDRPIAAACAAVTDWDELFWALCRNGLTGVASHYVTAGIDRETVPVDDARRIQLAYAISSIDTHAMLHGIGEELRAIQASGIDTIVLKGPALASLVYPHPSMRAFSDLDLMVRERDMERIHALLERLGFIAERDLSSLTPKLVSQSTTYELKYMHSVHNMRIEVHFDDLLNAGLVSRDIDAYWERAVHLNLGGITLKTLSLGDHLLHACAHMHYHGYVRLNWFTDVVHIIRDRAEQVDWSQFVASVKREEAQVPVYYSLHYLDRLLGVSAPADVISAVQPDRMRRRLHEYYLPSEQVCSLAPMPRPDFSFYFRPYFKRLLPDVLVMGRRREKVRYLMRLLIPHRAWLRGYYQVDPRRAIAPHYILHPLKLAAHALREARQAVRRPGGAWWNVECRG